MAPHGKHITRRELLRSGMFLAFHVWLLTSSFGCVLRRLPESVAAENTPASTSPAISPSPVISPSPEVTPTPVTVAKAPASPRKKGTPPASQGNLVEAKYYDTLDDNTTICQLCFRKCAIEEGKSGECLARKNINGKLYSLTYGNPVALHVDPVEREPLFHMEPGSSTLSIATASCNLRCKNCINWHIAYKAPEDVKPVPMTPDEVVQAAVEHHVHTLCFTYNEPTQQYDFMYDIARRAKEKNLRVTFHSNGGMTAEPMKAILPYTDSVAIDLKAFDPEVYRRLTEGELSPTLKTLKLVKEQGTWLEIVCLIIPTWNDDMADIGKMCHWIRDNLGEDTPVHFSRFYPGCKLTRLPPTPISTLEQAYEIARAAGLHYPYIDNVSGHDAANTYCPNCGEMLVHRKGLLIDENNIVDGKCKFCGRDIPGIWH
ncbi:AmmeMemoRadiSam system radical SAM enzyme [Chloroflexota bacterium]